MKHLSENDGIQRSFFRHWPETGAHQDLFPDLPGAGFPLDAVGDVRKFARSVQVHHLAKFGQGRHSSEKRKACEAAIAEFGWRHWLAYNGFAAVFQTELGNRVPSVPNCPLLIMRIVRAGRAV